MNERALLAERLTDLLAPARALEILARNVRGELGFLEDLAGPGGLTHRTVCEALVAFYGFELLFSKETRESIVEGLPGPLINDLWETLGLAGDGTTPNTERQRGAIRTLRMEHGSVRARRFCEALELPYACAGDPSSGSAPPSELFAPCIELPPLHPYQEELGKRITTELLAVGDNRRAMLALPTGGGKTRLVLETLLNHSLFEEGGGAILWVAQHEELCEQAIECIKQLWASCKRPANRLLKIQRVWDGKSSEIDWGADVIVGIPESLDSRVRNELQQARNRLRFVVIDEAHLSLASVYNNIFRLSSEARIPVLGVSATPSNTADPRGALQACYQNRLLRAASLGDRPYAALRDRGILSDIEFKPIESGIRITLSAEDRADLRGVPGKDYSATILDRIGRSKERNRLIVEQLLELPKQKPTLCFASSVPGARALASAMTVFGRTAALIDAETPTRLRGKILSAFRARETQFLFNYSVLAEGFDAPLVECLLIARPTRSLVRLEQMIGRGLRGPKNGGTASCKLIWITDDFSNAEELQPQSYQRFANLWKGAT